MNRMNPNDRFYMLPSGYKKIGYLIILVYALGLALIKITGNMPWFESIINKPLNGVTLKGMSTVVFIVAFICITWSREKRDDEMMSLLRFKAIRFTFLWYLVYFIFMAIAFIAGKETGPMMSGPQLMMGMLLVYQFSFLMQKTALS